MNRAIGIAIVALLVGLALAVSGYHYATSELLARHLCEADDLPGWAREPAVDGLIWIDRTGAKIKFGSNQAGLARFLIDRGYSVCADWNNEIPYFEDALVAAQNVDPVDKRLLIDALGGLAVKLMFVDPWRPAPRAAQLLRRLIAIRSRSFPNERDDLTLAKWWLAYVLARDCFAQSDPKVIAETRQLLGDIVAADAWQIDAWELRGDISALALSWAEAERDYREAFDRHVQRPSAPVEGHPLHAGTAEKLAIVLGMQGRKEAADDMVKRAADLRYGDERPTAERRCLAVPLAPGDIAPANKLWPF